MFLKNSDMKTFYERTKKKGIACIGIGLDFRKMPDYFSEFDWDNAIRLLIDNSPKRQGKREKIQNSEMVIRPLNDSIDDIVSNGMTVFITCTYYYEIFRQLDQIEQLNHTECYIYCFMMNKPYGEKIKWECGKNYKIPAKIHYCWFGRGEKPDLYKRCIESWHKYCENYEIIEWNENNCNIDENLYAKQAYEAEKYAFVADYFRMKVLYEQGGIYLDIDVELLKSLDKLRYSEAFFGMELTGKINSGVGMGAVPKHRIVGALLHGYDEKTFLDKNGKINDEPCPIRETAYLTEMGFKPENKQQFVGDAVIYPTWVLCPKNILTNKLEVCEDSIAIHHYYGSWAQEEQMKKRKERWRKAEELYVVIKEGLGK